MPDKTKKHSRLTIDAQQINGKAKCQWCGASYAIERNIIVDGYSVEGTGFTNSDGYSMETEINGELIPNISFQDIIFPRY